MADYPITTGFAYTLQSAQIDFKGSRILGIQSIKWQETMEGAELVYGASPVPLEETQGIYKATCEFEILWSSYMLLVRKLGDGFMQQRFNIGVQVRDAGRGLSSITIPQCRIIDKGGSLEQSKASVKSIKCSVLGVLEHDGFTSVYGQSLVGNVIGGAARVAASVGLSL